MALFSPNDAVDHAIFRRKPSFLRNKNSSVAPSLIPPTGGPPFVPFPPFTCPGIGFFSFLLGTYRMVRFKGFTFSINVLLPFLSVPSALSHN